MFTSSTSRQNQAGFTLIEILIVIAIISLLSAIAIPWYANYSDKARQASVLHDLRVCLTKTAIDINGGNTPADCIISEVQDYNDNPFIENNEFKKNPHFTVDSYEFEFDGRSISLKSESDDGQNNQGGGKPPWAPGPPPWVEPN